ncbi:MAG: hypothetical protein Q7R96_02565 [Nanoarchaeota archaeon]|nr:hypothetical protein [Nanoarchaeota archaeon]
MIETSKDKDDLLKIKELEQKLRNTEEPSEKQWLKFVIVLLKASNKK